MSDLVQPKPGYEFDWLAVDMWGHIALFSTSGYGLVPRSVVDHISAVEFAIGRLSSLPVVGECAESPEGDNLSFWIEPARRGLYGYDWGSTGVPPYARITVPSHPLIVDELSDGSVKEAATLVHLPVDFAAMLLINLEQLETSEVYVPKEPAGS